jgi:hypothetical protein
MAATQLASASAAREDLGIGERVDVGAGTSEDTDVVAAVAYFGFGHRMPTLARVIGAAVAAVENVAVQA